MTQSRLSKILQPTMKLCRHFAILAVAAMSVFSGIAYAATLTVTSNADTGLGSLRTAVSSAAAGDTIVFSGVSSIVLATPIVVSTSVTIAGPGANLLTISGNNVTRIFNVTTTTAATISGVTLSNGLANATALRGGAINNTGSLVLDGVALRSNSAFDGGGGIYNVSASASTGQLRILNSEISGNTVTDPAGIGGGAILSTSTSGSAASVVIINSTISGNTANANTTGMVGGGIYVSDGSLGIFSSTIATNRAGTAGGNIHVATLANTTLRVRNSIVTGGVVALGGVAAADTDIFQLAGATITSLGYNIITNRSGATGYAATDAANGTGAALGALGLSIGTTQTMVPGVGSAALGFVPAASCVDDAAVALTRDQRGVARPGLSSCDAGATETLRLSQTITGFTPASPVVFGAAPATLSATGGASGQPIVFATTSANTICTVLGNQVTFVGGGLCNLTANQAGNANYSAAPQVTASITINQATQTITGFAPASPVVFGASPATITATGGASGIGIVFATTSTNTICTVSGNQVTFTGVGACNLTANQAGNTNYSAAAQVTASITINQATQTITGFSPTSPVVFGAAPATLTAAGGASGIGIVFATTSANTICTVSGNQVTFVGAGVCNLTANQAGNGNYSAAAQVTASITINQASQTITGFAPASPVVFGAAPATLTATGGASGIAIVFATTSANTICTVSGNQVTFVGAGVCNLTANQAGSSNYSAAAQVAQSITINPANQTISFSSASVGYVGQPLSPSGTSTSNLALTYTSNTPTICTVNASSGVITMLTTGTCIVVASQTGNGNYNAATPVTINLTIKPPIRLADLSADGRADLLTRDAAGVLTARLMNGTTISSSATLLAAGPNWTVTHTGDFNGDGRTDLVFRNSADGSVVIYLMNGLTIQSSAAILEGGSPWVVAHVADFDGDGKSDILWRNTSDNSHAIWLMNGTTVLPASGGIVGAGPWLADQTGDFNGDGKADIVWRNTSDGSHAIWLMNGITVLPGSGGILAAGPWVASHVADFNGDGKSDILWRNTTDGGTVAMWTMNGTTVTGGGTIIGAGAWIATHVGDLDGDGKADILWRNTSDGTIAAWLMNGQTITSGTGLIGPNSGWTIQKLLDLNGDGKTDIVWRNTDGTIAVWLMNGLSVTSGATIVGPGTTAQVVP